jgi:hypothetical protein
MIASRLDLEALARRIGRVHVEQLAGEERGLLAAGAGANLHDDGTDRGFVASDEPLFKRGQQAFPPGVQ